MSDLLTLIAEQHSGTLTLGMLGNGSTRGSFVRGLYNALNNGTESVLVLIGSTPDEIVATAKDAADENNRVMVDTESVSRGDRKGQPRNAEDILGAIERRNSLNTSAPGSTYGAVKYDADTLNIGETVYGFTVKKGS